MHHPGDDDSSAVTFWGKRDLRDVLKIAMAKLDEHYAKPADGRCRSKSTDEERCLRERGHTGEHERRNGLFSEVR